MKPPKQQQATEIHSDKLSREWFQTYLDLLLSDNSLKEENSHQILNISKAWNITSKKYFFLFFLFP